MPSSVFLSARNISKSFVGVKALTNVSIDISRGQVLCLAGENGCGKSTLVKILAGIHNFDEGEIIIDGTSYSSITPKQAIDLGIQVIYQDLSLYPYLSVAENIAINKMVSTNKKLVDWANIQKIAQEQLDTIGVSIDLDMEVQELSVANKQIVAICRALALNAKVIFMDEPTTALTKQEVKRLLDIIASLKQRGMAIVFISHKLDEVFEISDVITVLRDGVLVSSLPASEIDTKLLSYYMTGREVFYPQYTKNQSSSNVLLNVQKLSKKGQFKNINFQCHNGDIVGFIGLLGSGRTEIALSLFGLNPYDEGIIEVSGQAVTINSSAVAKKMGIGLVSEDRSTQGVFPNNSMISNITSTVIENMVDKFGLIKEGILSRFTRENIKTFKIKVASEDTMIKTLSGGNQQKAIIAKWVATDPKVLILDSPTVGIDIGSKAEIYQLIHSLAIQGMGIIFISDEIEEIIHNCNKILVFSQGQIVKSIDNDMSDLDNLGKQLYEYMNTAWK